VSLRRGVLAGAAGAVAAWLATPVVATAVHGTLDQRTLAAWRRERRRPRPVVPEAWSTIPAQRTAARRTRPVRIPHTAVIPTPAHPSD
jgi:hypothetical protein